jgi:hypothetical protein
MYKHEKNAATYGGRLSTVIFVNFGEQLGQGFAVMLYFVLHLFSQILKIILAGICKGIHNLMAVKKIDAWF